MKKIKAAQKKEQVTPRDIYAAALAEILGPQDADKPKRKITPDYYKEFGQELAKAQIPPRAIPYNDFTIAGWVNGELLPTSQAQEAIMAVLADEYFVPQKTLDRLDTLYEDAHDWQVMQTQQPTELSHAMKHAVELRGYSQAAIAREMAKRNERWNNARSKDTDTSEVDSRKIARLSESRAHISSILGGQRECSPPRIMTYALEQICQPPFSLRAIHENSLRERADQLWITAERENDLGGLIKACRLRLGEGMEAFAQRIGQMAGKEEGFGNSSTCSYWEDNTNLPIGNSRGTGETLYVAIVRAMKLADHSPNGLSRSIRAPWFDEAKENTFRSLFHRAVQKANDGHFTIELPCNTAVPTPNPREVPKECLRYEGKLKPNLYAEKPNRA